MIRDWFMVLGGHRWLRAHVRTDPACRARRLPRHGSRLDRASRGVACPLCMGVRRGMA